MLESAALPSSNARTGTSACSSSRPRLRASSGSSSTSTTVLRRRARIGESAVRLGVVEQRNGRTGAPAAGRARAAPRIFVCVARSARTSRTSSSRVSFRKGVAGAAAGSCGSGTAPARAAAPLRFEDPSALGSSFGSGGSSSPLRRLSRRAGVGGSVGRGRQLGGDDGGRRCVRRGGGPLAAGRAGGGEASEGRGGELCGVRAPCERSAAERVIRREPQPGHVTMLSGSTSGGRSRSCSGGSSCVGPRAESIT